MLHSSIEGSVKAQAFILSKGRHVAGLLCEIYSKPQILQQCLRQRQFYTYITASFQSGNHNRQWSLVIKAGDRDSGLLGSLPGSTTESLYDLEQVT